MSPHDYYDYHVIQQRLRTDRGAQRRAEHQARQVRETQQQAEQHYLQEARHQEEQEQQAQ